MAHLAKPMAWPPESAVMSLAFRPLAENIEMSVERGANGDGISLFAAVRLAVLASLRPNGTGHVGPPSYNSNVTLFLVNNILKIIVC